MLPTLKACNCFLIQEKESNLTNCDKILEASIVSLVDAQNSMTYDCIEIINKKCNLLIYLFICIFTTCQTLTFSLTGLHDAVPLTDSVASHRLAGGPE